MDFSDPFNSFDLACVSSLSANGRNICASASSGVHAGGAGAGSAKPKAKSKAPKVRNIQAVCSVVPPSLQCILVCFIVDMQCEETTSNIGTTHLKPYSLLDSFVLLGSKGPD
jgi:hypothetical protein